MQALDPSWDATWQFQLDNHVFPIVVGTTGLGFVQKASLKLSMSAYLRVLFRLSSRNQISPTMRCVFHMKDKVTQMIWRG